MRIGSGSTMLAAPASQQPWMIVISARLVGPEDGDVVARHDAAGLQGGADRSGLVVQLRPRDRRVAAAAGTDGRTDEADAGRPISGCLQALRDRCWMWHFPRLSHADGAATTVAP